MTGPSVPELAAQLVAESERHRDEWVAAGRRVANLRVHGRTTPSNLVIAAANTGFYCGTGEYGMAREEVRGILSTLRDPGTVGWNIDSHRFVEAAKALELALDRELTRAA